MSNRNFKEALGRLPRTLQLMYIHAYQSYLWNRMVSFRLKTLGMKPAVGDLVLCRDDEKGARYRHEISVSPSATPSFSALFLSTLSLLSQPCALWHWILTPLHRPGCRLPRGGQQENLCSPP